MIGIQKMQLETLCQHHSLVLSHICVTKFCQCQIKLCEKCCTEHEKDNQNSNFLKIENYQIKIQTEISIYQKQLQSTNSSRNNFINNIKQANQKLDKFTANQVNLLEQSMKFLNHQSKNVIQDIKNTSNALTQQINEIQKKRLQMPEKYAQIILDKQLLNISAEFLNQKGFASFRKKLDKILIFRKMINDFLQNAQKYGRKYQNFMKVSSKIIAEEYSMKRSMIEILPNYKLSDEKANIDGNFYSPQQKKVIKGEERMNNLIPNANQQQVRKRRATTIFGKK